MFTVMTNKNTSTPKSNLEERKQASLLAVNSIGRTRTHGLSDMQERRNATLERIEENGRGYRRHGRRPEKTTKEDLSPITKGLGLLAFGGVALVGAVSYHNHKENEVQSKLRNTPTTEVIAEPGSSYAGAQGIIGYDGLNEMKVVDFVMGLPENDDDKNGEADPVHPGDKITVLNFNEDKQP